MTLVGGKWDVFISHAHEDKGEIALPLAKALRKQGLEVWYDEFSLRLGDSLQGGIEEGLKKSRFGVVVLSRAFFAKKWPRRELEGLLARESVSGDRVLLPVWHKVTHEEVYNYSPIVAGVVAVSTSSGRAFVVRKIVERVAPQNVVSVSASSRLSYGLPNSRLFTYGTAISLEQLGRYLRWSPERTHSAFLNPRVGTLRDYKLAFSTPYGDEAPGRGVSNIEHSPGASLEGVVYDVGEGVLNALGGKVVSRYWLVPVDIELQVESTVRCQTFIAKSPRTGLRPHREFIDYMVRVSEIAGLRPEFVQRLRECEVLGGSVGS